MEAHHILIRRKIGRLEICFKWRKKCPFWGRFGGGWNWELGFQAGGRTLLVNLIFCSLVLHWGRAT